jgi:hypothetical protein
MHALSLIHLRTESIYLQQGSQDWRFEHGSMGWSRRINRKEHAGPIARSWRGTLVEYRVVL